MANNNPRQNVPDWQSQHTPLNPRPYDPNHQQHNYQGYQPGSYIPRQQHNQVRYGQQVRPGEYDHGQPSRGVTAQSPGYSPGSEPMSGLSGLSALGRQVHEPVGMAANHEGEKFTGVFNKYAGGTGRDLKMASSAIFPNNNAIQSDFSRFPTFNLGINQHTEQSTASSTSSTTTSYDGAKKAQNETPQERKQRELLEIKKQLEEINKKMKQQTEKNSQSANQGSLGDNLRPARPAGISQSVIIESNNFSSGAQSLGFGFNQQSRPYGATGGLSIDQLYAQKKGLDSTRPPQTTDNTSKYQLNNPFTTDTQPKPPTVQAPSIQGYQPRASQQPRKYQDTTNKVSPSQSYDYNASKSSSSYQTHQEKAVYAPYTPKIQQVQRQVPGYANGNSGSTNTNSYGGNSYGMGGYGTGSYGANTYGTANNYTNTSGSTAQNTQSAQSYSYGKPTEQSQGGVFKKKKEAVVYEPVQTLKTELRKPVFQAKPYPEISKPVQQPHQSSSLRKIASITDQQNYQLPVPHLKQFKVTDFAIGKKMGKGQFGEVMLVRHKETGWVCGLKVMEKKQIREEDYVGQIARELSIQFYLEHRNIANLYGYFQDQKNVYLLVEFCTGGQLLERLRGERRMNEKDVAVIIRQVCEGIDYIHKELIIHRDIKPENILFNFGVVKISDFGWAVYRGFGMRKTASGSPLYYPPEIVKGESYDDKIDIWNIGMMTYECILGKIPFRVYTEMDLGRIVSDEITFPSYVDVTDEAKDFILKTMKKKGEERMEIRQMLRHPFLTKNQQTELNPAILEEFKRVLH